MMLRYLTFITINSWYLALLLAVVLFVYRIALAYSSEYKIEEKLLIVLLPCSFGVYIYCKNQKLKTYNVLLIMLFVSTFLASAFIFYVLLSK